MLGASLLGGLAAAGAAGGEISSETVAASIGPEPLPPTSLATTTTTTAAPVVQPPAPTTTVAQPKVVVAARPNPVPASTGSTVEAAIRQWFPENYSTALRIARCESGLNPRAIGGGNSYGLFQIHHVHRRNFTSVTGVSWEQGWFDPGHNAHYARQLYNSSGWRPWACA